MAEVLREVEECMFWMRLLSWSCISSRLMEGARAGEACLLGLSSTDRERFLTASLSALNLSTLLGDEGKRVGAGGCGEARGDIWTASMDGDRSTSTATSGGRDCCWYMGCCSCCC